MAKGEIGPDFKPGKGLNDNMLYRWSVETDNRGIITTSWSVSIINEIHSCGRDVQYENKKTDFNRNYIEVIGESNKLTKDELFGNSSYQRLLEACNQAVSISVHI
jgi:hypothetical protein